MYFLSKGGCSVPRTTAEQPLWTLRGSRGGRAALCPLGGSVRPSSRPLPWDTEPEVGLRAAVSISEVPSSVRPGVPCGRYPAGGSQGNRRAGVRGARQGGPSVTALRQLRGN